MSKKNYTRFKSVFIIDIALHHNILSVLHEKYIIHLFFQSALKELPKREKDISRKLALVSNREGLKTQVRMKQPVIIFYGRLAR